MIKFFLMAFYILTSLCFFTSCNKSDTGYAPSAAIPSNSTTDLFITPSSVSLAVNNSVSFSAAGGVAPYSFSIASGGGVIISASSLGNFTAPAAPSVVTVKLTDSVGSSVMASVTVNSALQISPTSQTILINSTLAMTASGGVAPYVYSISSGTGSINSSSGIYQAPAANTVVVLKVTDSLGNTSSSTVNVTSGLSIAPASISIPVNNLRTFVGSGGTPPLVYSVTGGGVINSSSGVYTAPAGTGSAVVHVTDSLGAVANASVTIVPALSISPPSITVSVNGTLTFTTSGGAAPISFSVFSGSGTINSSTGAYTAPTSAGSAVVRATDSFGNIASANVTVTNALGISPAAITLAVNNSTTFAAVGGAGPYVYSLVSGGGVINSSTGAFTAPAVAGTVVVRVTDSLAATANATVTVNPAISLSPSSATKPVNSSTAFSAAGGVTPYTYSIVSGGGTINSATGAYTAPAIAATVTIRVTDSLSNVANSTLTVVSALAINPTAKTLAVNNTFTFAAVGGQAPYTYSILSGTGTVNSGTGAYVAPASAGSAVVRVTDSIGQIADATVTINAALVISPTSVNLPTNGTQVFSSSGGVSPNTFSIFSGGGVINSSTGSYTAPAAGGSATVRVTDSLGNTANASVTITAAVATKLAFTAQPLSATVAGVAFSVQPVVQIQDSGGAVVSSATNSVTLAAFSDASCTVAKAGTLAAAANPVAASTGQASFNGTSFTKVGVLYLKASTAGLTSACSSGVVINPAAASQYILSGYPAVVDAWVANNFSVTAYDMYLNVATGYTGKIRFTSSDLAAVLPADYTFISADAGTKNFSVSLRSYGTQSLTGTDFVTASINGSQTGITVHTYYTYALSTSANKINASEINMSSGALINVTGSPFLASGTNPLKLVASPTGQFLYSGNGVSGEISGYKINPANGALTVIAGSPFLIDPTASIQSVTISRDGKYLYATDNSNDVVFALAINLTTGALTAVPGSPFTPDLGPAEGFTSPNGNYLYIVNSVSNSISGFSINAASGALTNLAGFPVVTGLNPVSLSMDPAGKFLNTSDYSAKTITAFTANSTTGALTLVAAQAAGNAPSWNTIDPNLGKFAYATNDTDGTISGFNINAVSGALSPIAGAPFSVGVGANPVAVVLDPTAKFLFTANLSANTISAFKVNAATGVLTAVVGSPFATSLAPVSVIVVRQ